MLKFTKEIKEITLKDWKNHKYTSSRLSQRRNTVSRQWKRKKNIKKIIRRGDFESTYSRNLISIDENKLIPVVRTSNQPPIGGH